MDPSVGLISSEELVHFLDGKLELLLIDCRSFMEYHTSNIKSAINISGNRLIRRRLQQNKLLVSELITKRLAQTSTRSDLPRPSVPVVVYDQCTDSLTNLKAECFAHLIIEQLNTLYEDVRLLKGGFLDFKARFPAHCWENTGKFADEDFVGTLPEEASLYGLEDTDGGRCPTIPKDGGPKKLLPDIGASKRSGSPLTSPVSKHRSVPTTTDLNRPLTTFATEKWQPLSGPALSASNPGPTEILDHIILGCQADAMTRSILRLHRITHILNVSVDGPASPHVQLTHFLRIPVNDNYVDRILPHLQKAFDFLNGAKAEKGRVLVHCSAGISRSPTIAIAYLMKYHNMIMKQAYELVKERRPTVSPNFNFMGQLVDYEQQLQSARATSSTSAIQTQPAGGGPKRRERPSRLAFSPYSGTTGGRSPTSELARLRSRVLQADMVNPTLPSPSTHFAGLDISSPATEEAPGRAFLVPVTFPDDSGLRRYHPTATLDQLHFEPCWTGRPLLPKSYSGVLPPPPASPEHRAVVEPSQRPSGEVSEPLMRSEAATSGVPLVTALLRRTRSFEDVSTGDDLTGAGWARISEASCRQAECHHSSSSISSGNSHSSNHGSFGLYPVS